MKKTITLLIIIVFLSGCNYKIVNTEDLNEKEVEDLFKKKQECISYKDEIESKINEKNSGNEYKTLIEDIIYSPKSNSCLVVEHTIFPKDYGVSELFVLRDILENDIITQETIGEDADLQQNLKQKSDFQKRLDEYKK